VVEVGAHAFEEFHVPHYDAGSGTIEEVDDLTTRSCVPCRGGVPPLKGAALEPLKARVSGWTVVDEHHLQRDFKFKNFRDALAFTNRVGELAEREGHHPDITLTWGRVRVVTWTHKIDGLTDNDFILAAKIDAL
jgi:4a-hydroxytetrahydrobiopterin dehydratase